MSDSSHTLVETLNSCLKLHYPEQLVTLAVLLYKRCSEEYKVYIIGCLVLTLSASVKPQFTLLEDRRKSLLESQLYSPEKANELAEIGLYLDDPCRAHLEQQASLQHREPRLVCFHCSSKIHWASGSLAAHRDASPGCYFVRFFDFVSCLGEDPRLTEGVIRDIGRYIKALRKLKADLTRPGMDIAATYGYSMRQLTFFATRHFMRNSGRIPDRAGDILELVHTNEPLFNDLVPNTVEVLKLLEPLKLLQAAMPSRSEGGYHSARVGQYDPRSGTPESTAHSLTSEQLQAYLRPNPSGASSLSSP